MAKPDEPAGVFVPPPLGPSEEALTDRFDDLTLAELTERAERLGYPAWRATPSGRKMAIWHGDEAAALRWLLRQPEALARAACYARGVADGRALERGEHKVTPTTRGPVSRS